MSDLPQSNVDKSTIDYESPTYFNELRSEFFGITGAKPTLLSLPYQVSYASLGLLGTTFLKEDSASLQILSQLLTFKYLHKEVREKGGAYGGGVRYGGVDGLFGYYSIVIKPTQEY